MKAEKNTRKNVKLASYAEDQSDSNTKLKQKAKITLRKYK